MLLTIIRKEARASDSPFKVIEGAVAGSFFDREAEGLQESTARVVEGDVLRAIAVGPAETSQFSAFLDGVQRAEVKLYYDSVPIVYAFGAAVIRERSDRHMRTLRMDGAEAIIEREALFYPSQHIAPEHLLRLGAPPEQLIDTTPPGADPVPLFPPLLHARAAHAICRWREGLERTLAARWCARPQGFLLIDGSLTVSPDVAECKSVVGLIKSHRTRFFDGDEARVVLNLQCGQRTSMFEPGTRSFTPVRSWYLRVRPPAGHDVFWGLVRIEVAIEHDPPFADQVSRWLLAETTPLSLPDARWDRLLYPVHDCEGFLRARAPGL